MTKATLLLLFASTSQTHNLPDGLLESLCWVESSHNVKALHMDDGGSNSVGVCQIKLATARLLGFKGTEEQLRDPKTNVFYAGRYLSRQLRRYVGNVHMGVAAYNSGTFRLAEDGKAKNQKYVDKVVTTWSKKYAPVSSKFLSKVHKCKRREVRDKDGQAYPKGRPRDLRAVR